MDKTKFYKEVDIEGGIKKLIGEIIKKIRGNISQKKFSVQVAKAIGGKATNWGVNLSLMERCVGIPYSNNFFNVLRVRIPSEFDKIPIKDRIKNIINDIRDKTTSKLDLDIELHRIYPRTPDIEWKQRLRRYGDSDTKHGVTPYTLFILQIMYAHLILEAANNPLIVSKDPLAIFVMRELSILNARLHEEHKVDNILRGLDIEVYK